MNKEVILITASPSERMKTVKDSVNISVLDRDRLNRWLGCLVDEYYELCCEIKFKRPESNVYRLSGISDVCCATSIQNVTTLSRTLLIGGVDCYFCLTYVSTSRSKYRMLCEQLPYISVSGILPSQTTVEVLPPTTVGSTTSGQCVL